MINLDKENGVLVFSALQCLLRLQHSILDVQRCSSKLHVGFLPSTVSSGKSVFLRTCESKNNHHKGDKGIWSQESRIFTKRIVLGGSSHDLFQWLITLVSNYVPPSWASVVINGLVFPLDLSRILNGMTLQVDRLEKPIFCPPFFDTQTNASLSNLSLHLWAWFNGLRVVKEIFAKDPPLRKGLGLSCYHGPPKPTF